MQFPYERRFPYNQQMDWIQVQSIEQVESVAVQPNTKAWIMVQNEPVFALRQADAMGLVNTDYYRFEKYEPVAKSYVTMDDLAKTIEQLKGDINESIANLTKRSNKQSNTTKHKTIDADATEGE